ncbi:WhiB family transcriptional regulator [Streptomyces uncialis]|uniref:WhiB family transcriptional regulator n=1 Tax=Streptomyces uncialis TaxID=1048205 RepID=UPI00378C4A87
MHLDTSRAACRALTAPDLWYSEPTTGDAKAVCDACPIRRACAEYALAHDEPHGVWGGLTVRERRRILDPDTDHYLDRGGRIRRPCGSFGALLTHRSRGETCARCEATQQQRIEQQRRQAAARRAARQTGAQAPAIAA